jgi:polysaccharide export outer membrane protein
MWKSLVLPVGLLLVAGGFSGCATDSVTSSTPAASSTGAVVQNARANADSAEYRIGPGDVLDVNVFQVPDLSRTVQVDGSGNITLPLINAIKVGGKTPPEAQQEIADKLGKTYLQSPQVSVLVKESGQRISVAGAVQHPQVVPVSGGLNVTGYGGGSGATAGMITLNQAIAAAGGTNDVADQHRVHVARIGENGHVQDLVFDLTAIQSGKIADPHLQGGDIVVVETSGLRQTFKSLKDLTPFAYMAGLFL